MISYSGRTQRKMIKGESLTRWSPEEISHTLPNIVSQWSHSGQNSFPSKEQWWQVDSVVYQESSLKSVPRVLNWGWLYRHPLFRGGTTVTEQVKKTTFHSSNISIWYIIFCTCWWISFATIFEYFSVDSHKRYWLVVLFFFFFYVDAIIWFGYGYRWAYRMSWEVLLLLFLKYLGIECNEFLFKYLVKFTTGIIWSWNLFCGDF